MTRKRVTVGIAAVAAVAAAVIVAVAHSGPSAKHEAVAQYIQDVDAIQQQMKPLLTETSSAFRSFATGTPVDATELAHARRTLHLLNLRLRGLEAPPEAARLRTLLLRVTDAEEGVAVEVNALARFAPPFTRVIRRSQAASAELSRALGAVAPPRAHRIRGTKKQVDAARAAFAKAAASAAAQQADAVAAYVAALTDAKRALERLHPPLIMRPSYRTQLQTYAASISSGTALAAELRKQNRARLPDVSRKFTIASRHAGAVSAQKAQRAAVVAYNTRVRAIGALQAQIRGELVRVQTLAG